MSRSRSGQSMRVLLAGLVLVGETPSSEDLVILDGELIETIGTEMFGASVLGPLYVSAEQLSVEQPDNEVLVAATTKLRERFLPGFGEGPKFGSAVARDLATAIRERRAVEITYTRAWEPGVHSRTIHPYVFETTSRGLEVDAEPAEKPGEVRTFLIGNIRDVQVLSEHFQTPDDVERRCLDNRATKTVEGRVPTNRRWTIEKWAERATFDHSDSQMSTFEAELLEPYEHRVSLMMLVAGPQARLLRPDDELAAGLANRLLELHNL